MIRFFASAFLAVNLLLGFASAQQKPAEGDKDIDIRAYAARAAALAPFLDEQTIVVGRLDTAQLELADAAKQLKKLLGDKLGSGLGDQLDKGVLAGGVMKGAFNVAGGRDAYLIVSLADVPSRAPFGVIPTAKAADATALARMLRPMVAPGDVAPPGIAPTPSAALQRSFALVCEPMGDAVFIGPAATLARLKDRRAALTAEEISRRWDLAGALAAAGDGTVQVVFLMSDDQRRVMDEMLPNLPPALGGGSTKPFSEGFRFAAMGMNVSEKLAVRLTIQAKDAAAAETQSAAIAAGLQLFAQSPQVKKQLSTAEKVAKALAPRVKGNQVVIELNEENKGLANVVSGLVPAVVQARTAAERAQNASNLKQIGLALHNYHDTYRAFPARAKSSAAGKPLLSWRVHVLPFLEADGVYKEFRLDEPWDSEHNKKLISKMPEIFRAAGSKNKRESGKTNFLAPVYEGSALAADVETKIAEIRDGTSNTIAVVEVTDEAAVPWTKPEDWEVDEKDPTKGLGETFAALFCDASVHFFKKDIAPETLRALLTRAGGEVVAP
jgi:hypothetical protein